MSRARALDLLRRHGLSVFGLLLLVGAVWVVQRQFRELSVAQVARAMEAIPAQALWLSAGLAVSAYLVLAIYDKLGANYAGKPSGWGRAFLASFCGYSLAHNIGFAAVSGAAVRYRLYSAWGYSPVEIGKVIGFTSLTFGLGGLALAGAVLLFEPGVIPVLPDHLPRWALQALALPLFAAVAAYVLLSRFRREVTLFKHTVELPGVRLALAQTLLATVDVAVTAAIFFVLLPPADGLTFMKFLGIYLAAYSAGIFAHVPGGIGVFDGIVLLGLGPYLGAAEVVGALLVFRLYYYIVPLFVSGALFAGFELSQRRRGGVLARFGRLGTPAMPLEVPALAGLVALSGALLVFLGALPVRDAILQQWAGAEAAVASQFAASVVGSLLLVMSFGLARRLTLAWGASLVLLANGALIAALRGEAWWTWGAFLAVAAFLATMRASFYRNSRLRAEPLSGEMLVPLVAVALCGLTLASVSYNTRVQDAAWWEVVFAQGASAQLRFTVGLGAVLLLAGVARLLRRAPLRTGEYDAAARTRLGSAAPVEADAVLWGERGEAVLAFRRGEEGMWVAEGDPAGEARDAVSAIWRFRDLCERNGARPAFRGVGERFLRVYADIGLQAVPDPARPGRWLACDPARDLRRLTAAAGAG